MTALNNDEILEKSEKITEQILERIVTWLSDGSGWVIEEILFH